MAKSSRTKKSEQNKLFKQPELIENPKSDKKDIPADTKPVITTSKPAQQPAEQTQREESKNKPTVSDLFHRYMQFYTSKILPAYLRKYNITTDEFVERTLNLVRNNEKLVRCLVENPASLFASILFGAEYGLIASEGIQHFFIIPYNVQQENGNRIMTAKPQIGYQGCVHILTRSGKVKSIQAECVFKGDTFEYELGLDRKLKHIPNLSGEKKSENIEYVYSVAKMNDGEKEFTVLTKGQVIAIQNLAKTVNSLYFNDARDPNNWMIKKTAIKQLAKLLPKEMEVQKAFDYDSKIEGGGTLILDENQEMKLIEDGSKIIEGARVVPKRVTKIYDTWGK